MKGCASLLCLLFLCVRAADAEDPAAGVLQGEGTADGWQADHHMHLASPDICERIGDCLAGNDPPSVLAVDAIAALDAARVSRGVVFSSAYLYGLEDLALDPETVAGLVRRENEFTAAEVSPYSGRLVGFLSIDPLQPSALDELSHWRGSRELAGVKLHFAASGVDLRNDAHRDAVAAVLRQADSENLPLAIHIGGGRSDAADAEVFIRILLPETARSWVQIAHAGGGYPFEDGRHVRILDAFADSFARNDSSSRRVLFDISYVPAPEEDPETAHALARAMRRIGMERFLFGSDFNVLTPAQQIGLLDRLGLDREESAVLRENCAPWICPVESASVR